jgi:hypothetical protein
VAIKIHYSLIHTRYATEIHYSLIHTRYATKIHYSLIHTRSATKIHYSLIHTRYATETHYSLILRLLILLGMLLIFRLHHSKATFQMSHRCFLMLRQPG